MKSTSAMLMIAAALATMSAAVPQGYEAPPTEPCPDGEVPPENVAPTDEVPPVDGATDGGYGNETVDAGATNGTDYGSQPPVDAATAGSYGAPPPPPCNETTTGNCPAGVTYSAALYQQRWFAGQHAWVDGTDGECRGLEGVPLGSIKVLSAAGGDVVTGEATDEFAQGVKLTFYPEYACAGEPLYEFDGTVIDTDMPTGNALSVKLSCNGQGSGVPAAKPVSERFSATLYEERNEAGNKHWVDGVIGECRGLSGVPVGSLQFVDTPGGSNPVGDDVAKQVGLVFYSDVDCGGKELSYTNAAKVDNACDAADGACSLAPLSVAFVDPATIGAAAQTALGGSVTQQSESSSASELVVKSGVAMLAAAVSSLLFA